MLEQQNVKAVQECYAAYGSKDLDKFFACMTPDIDWELTDVPGLAFTGQTEGMRAGRRLFRAVRQEARSTRIYTQGIHRSGRQGGRPGAQRMDGEGNERAHRERLGTRIHPQGRPSLGLS